eukprot:TRINITY_DN16693_c0_g1_i2.p1 TRINITY_DN16693_c0_g1~~TRINITY_DN16693_c0_g1_i2.p1  ORF type:complete len:305 (+),score=44.25 TRINITY_DN16693_c0_g1_i2:7-921(+)
MYRLLNSTYRLCNKRIIPNSFFKTNGVLSNGFQDQLQCSPLNCFSSSSGSGGGGTESQSETKVPSIHRKLPDFLIATEFVTDVLIDGIPLPSRRDEMIEIGAQLENDGVEIVKQAMIWQHEKIGVKGPIKSMIELSVVLCSEGEIRKINKKHREIDSATDVLSFRMSNDEDIEGMPMVALGDVIICVPIALVQAKQRRYELLDELRVLLVHGVLHLLGYDHDKNDQEWDLMSEAEQFILSGLGWKGQGLIEAQGSVPIHAASEIEQKGHTIRVPLKKFMRGYHTLPASQQLQQYTPQQQQHPKT